ATFKQSCLILMALLLIFFFTKTFAQNIVDEASTNLAANPAKLTETDFSEFILVQASHKMPASAKARRISEKLEKHAIEFLDGFPWKPFQHTIGISGYEVYFEHPAEVFYSLSLARPYLSPRTSGRAKSILSALLTNSPPWSLEGSERSAGTPRESYDVPPNLRLKGRAPMSSAFGVYAFWSYCNAFNDVAAARHNWSVVRDRMQPLLATKYKFEIHKRDYNHDEVEILNGDLAGLLGLSRLAKLTQDSKTEQLALRKARELLQLRVDFERVNAQILEKSSASTKHLHYYKLSRFCNLTFETAEALRKLSAGCAAGRLKPFREERNGWFIAYGDRFIGGENYTSPPHLARALFTGAALIEELPSDELFGFVDVPWCKGDLFFMEKCVYALWADSGRNWEKATGEPVR
ncbi:MAG: Serine/threonine protein kinase related protein, partial [Verrucomicrobiales bacterium]|nr:Serine/threonine protein kinase related protein [Verrucomicrobiales bacterium]